MNIQPVTLCGTIVRLDPLDVDHATGLLELGRDEDLWTHLTREPFVDRADVDHWIAEALVEQSRGRQLPFAVIHRSTGGVIGSTRYLNISPNDRGLEIGWTFYAAAHRRTAVNTECKLLLLRHAFEELNCARVQLKTDALNERSRRAIERIGGVFEGVLRRLQRTRGGRIRDTAVYSIIDEEWPAVRDRLEGLLRG